MNAPLIGRSEAGQVILQFLFNSTPRENSLVLRHGNLQHFRQS
jgi:hypothetical protein